MLRIFFYLDEERLGSQEGLSSMELIIYLFVWLVGWLFGWLVGWMFAWLVG